MTKYAKAKHPASYYYKEESHECPTCGDKFFRGTVETKNCSCGRMWFDITKHYIRSMDRFNEFKGSRKLDKLEDYL